MTSYTAKIYNSLYSLGKEERENSQEVKVNIPYKLGCIPDKLDYKDYQISSILSTRYLGENKVDYINEMSSVKSQGNLGSCVAFSIAAVLEWQQQKEYLRERKRGSNYLREERHYDLSEQWIYYNAKKIDPWPNSEGTSIRCGMKIINNKGVPEEEGWPYSDSTIGSPKFWAYSTAEWAKNKKYYRIRNLEELKETLVKVGPCSIGVLVFEEMFYPDNNGVVSYPSNTNRILGGHALCCIGFNNNKELVKIKNSWGTNWGTSGYGYLPYKYIKDFMMDAWVTIDKNVNSL